jgi:hypothetical protein
MGYVCYHNAMEFARRGNELHVPPSPTGTAGSLARPRGFFHCSLVCIYHPKSGEPAPCGATISVNATWDTVRKLLQETT